MRRALAVAACAFAAATSQTARAEGDGAYGRLDGDLLVQAGAGVAAALGGPHLVLDVHMLYLSTAGIYARYTDACGQKNAAFARDIATGIELRPLFLGRWAQDLERGPPTWDLWLDSLSFQFGAAWQEKPGAPFTELPSYDIGVGFEFPLFARASGLFLGVDAIARLDGLDRPVHRTIFDQGSLLVFTLSWHQIARLGLADLRDRR